MRLIYNIKTRIINSFIGSDFLKKRKKKRKLLKFLCLAITLVSLCVWVFNNLVLITTEETITDSEINGEIKIALISDLHVSAFSNTEKILNEVKETEPDIIFVLGDMHSRGQISKISRVTAFLTRLADIADVYAVTGDHDYSEEYKSAISDLDNVTLLDYAYSDIDIKGNKLRVYGIDNVYFSDTFDLSNEFETLPSDRINILLSHIPSMQHYGNFGFDYIFCGDTHGGMVRLPYLGGLYYNGYILPKLTYNGVITDKGLYEFNETSLYVTSGVGNYPIPLRFNNKPEICLIKLKGE